MKAVFWDNDGVLVDTERLYFQANREVLADLGFDLSTELYREHWLLSWTGLLAIGESLGFTPARIEELRNARDVRYAHLLETEDILIPGVEETVRELSKHVLQAIVTSSKRDHFEIIHRRTGLLEHFQFTVAAGDYARSKPAPDPYLVALERAGVSPADCLVIEDSERGLRAATAAGLRCWVIPSPLAVNADFSEAERILSSTGEVVPNLQLEM